MDGEYAGGDFGGFSAFDFGGWSFGGWASLDSGGYGSAMTMDQYNSSINAPTTASAGNNSNSFLFTTNGTILGGSLTPDNYYRDAEGNGNSANFTNELADKLGISKDNSYFLSWSGQNKKGVRDLAIDSFVKDIISTPGLTQDSEITLFGHSHGGNIMVGAGDQLTDLGYNVKMVYSIDAPVRQDYQPNGSYNMIQTYSNKDWAQTKGTVDFDHIMTPEPVYGGHTFNVPGVNNIDITNFYNSYYSNSNYSVPSGPCSIHQAGRDFNFLSSFLF